MPFRKTIFLNKFIYNLGERFLPFFKVLKKQNKLEFQNAFQKFKESHNFLKITS